MKKLVNESLDEVQNFERGMDDIDIKRSIRNKPKRIDKDALISYFIEGSEIYDHFEEFINDYILGRIFEKFSEEELNLTNIKDAINLMSDEILNTWHQTTESEMDE